MRTRICLILAAALTLMVGAGACSKGDSNGDDPRSSAKGITAEEMTGYMIIEEFEVAPAYIQELGDHPILYVYAVERHGDRLLINLYRHNGYSSINMDGNMTYTSETSVTKMNTSDGYIELTKDLQGNILLKGGLQFKDKDKKLISKYVQLVKLGSQAASADRVYKATEGGNSYYRFKDTKWAYNPQQVPLTPQLTWLYEQLSSQVWNGEDGGTTKYYNRFIIIPKGQGWKGKYTDKEILLVNVSIDGKGTGDLGVYEAHAYIEPDPAKAITADELTNYLIIEEFQVKSTHTSSLGNHPYLITFSFVQSGVPQQLFVIENYGEGFVEYTTPDNMSYDKATGVTTVKSKSGHLELTRDEDENIIVKNGLQFSRNSTNPVKDGLISRYIQVIKGTTGTFYNRTYKVIEGFSGSYRFNEQKWRYSAQGAPLSTDLTWNYDRTSRTVWHGLDGSALSSYGNTFVILPKGNGWKGKYKDKTVMLVTVAIGHGVHNFGVCTMDE